MEKIIGILPWISSTTLVLVASVAFAGTAIADEVYIARLSAQDHQNSNGEKLTSASAILRQDRAIWHDLGGADGEDQADNFFSKKSNRAAYEKLLDTGMIGDAEKKAIVNGTPLVKVTITYDEGMKQHFVSVNVLEKGGESRKSSSVETESARDGSLTKSGALAKVRDAGYLRGSEKVSNVKYSSKKGVWIITATVDGDPDIEYRVNDQDGSVARITQ